MLVHPLTGAYTLSESVPSATAVLNAETPTSMPIIGGDLVDFCEAFRRIPGLMKIWGGNARKQRILNKIAEDWRKSGLRVRNREQVFKLDFLTADLMTYGVESQPSYIIEVLLPSKRNGIEGDFDQYLRSLDNTANIFLQPGVSDKYGDYLCYVVGIVEREYVFRGVRKHLNDEALSDQEVLDELKDLVVGFGYLEVPVEDNEFLVFYKAFICKSPWVDISKIL